MSYETVANISQILSMLMFFAMFVGVVVYACWPTNGARFDAVQRAALNFDTTKDGTKGRP